jgi:hypothetical protein
MSSVVGEVIQYLVAHRRCSGCGAAFQPENVHVIHQPARWTWDLAAVCHDCHTLTMVSAVVRPDDPPRRRLRLATELTPSERAYFRDLAPVDADDVLDVAEFLGAFDGDFRGLFSRNPDDL